MWYTLVHVPFFVFLCSALFSSLSLYDMMDLLAKQPNLAVKSSKRACMQQKPSASISRRKKHLAWLVVFFLSWSEWTGVWLMFRFLIILFTT